MHIHLHIYMRNHNGIIINRRAKASLTIYTSNFIARFVCERELDTERRLQYIDPPTPMADSVVSFSFSRGA